MAIPSQRRQGVRNLPSEAEFIAKLQAVVNKGDPNLSYARQKKIGQGASGSVYVAKIKDTAVGMARQLALAHGSDARVAIKEMNLARQQRKELLIDEITIMKEGRHGNIINFLEAFLFNDNKLLWVVMDFMEGGALIDIIDNNPSIAESHMATICREVCCSLVFASLLDLFSIPSLPQLYPSQLLTTYVLDMSRPGTFTFEEDCAP